MTKGQCYKVNINDETQENLVPLSGVYGIERNYYKAGYAQAGFDFKYLSGGKDELEYDLIYGAPGFNQWNGIIPLNKSNH